MKTIFHWYSPLLLALAAFIACLGAAIAQDQEPAPAPEQKPTPVAEDDDWRAEVQQAIDDLSSDDFRTRENATLKLWKIGDRAEPYVREAATTNNIEVRVRTKMMLNHFRYGIYPSTPPEIVALINKFRYGSLTDKTNAIKELYAKGAMANAAKLVRTIDDASIRKRLVGAAVNELRQKIESMFADENYEEAENLLKLAAIADDGMRDLAAFHLQRGTLEREIGLLRDKIDPLLPVEHEQLSWFLRFKGDLDGALAAAETASNDNLVRDVRIARGELTTLIKASFNPNDRTIQTYGFTAASQRLNGDARGFEETILKIKAYAVENPVEETQCLEALLANGRVADAIDVAKPGSTNRTQVLVDNGYVVRALAELGIDNPRPPYTGWLDALCDEFAAAKTPTEYEAILARAYTLARLLAIAWGEEAEARRIFEKLGQVVVKKEPEFLNRLIANAHVLGLHESALKLSRAGLAQLAGKAVGDLLELRGADADGPDPRDGAELSLISALYNTESSVSQFWWTRLGTLFPKETSFDRLDRLELLMGPHPDGTKQRPGAIELVGEILSKSAKGGGDDADLLSQAAGIYLRHDDRPTAMELYAKALTLERQDRVYPSIRFAGMLAEDEKWADAARYYKQASDEIPGNTALLTLHGIALERAGRQDEGAAIIQRAKLRALGSPGEHVRMAGIFAEFDDYGRAKDCSQLALNVATLDEASSVFLELLRLSDYLIYEDPARAASYKERYAIECLKTHVRPRSLAELTNIYATVGIAKARLAIAENRLDQAVMTVQELTDAQPANTSILEDLYPLLAMAGRKKEADEIFDKLDQHGTTSVEIFPNSPSALNSLAWLKARCGKDLDKALEYSQRSNKLREGSYAYIDTLAEVYFQMGDRKKAVELSEEAVSLASGDFLLHHQLERFKNAKPLSELLGDK